MRFLLWLLPVLFLGCGLPDILIPPVVDPPGPPVIVTPVTGSVWAIVLEETAERTPETAILLADVAYWNARRAGGVELRPYDVDSPDAASYVAATASIPRPTILLLDTTGRKLFAGPLPTDTPQMDRLLKQVGK